MRTFALALSLILLTSCGDDPGAGVTIETGDLIEPAEFDAADEATQDESSTDDRADAVAGRWRSAGDSSVVVTFESGTFQESYDGEVLTEGTVAFSEGCPDTPSGDLFAFTVDGDGDAICYHVVEAGGDRLAYSMAGGRGNTLAFARAE